MSNYTALQYKKFFSGLATTSLTTVYTCPAGYQDLIKDIVIDNGTAAAIEVTICVVPQAQTPGPANAIIYLQTIPANQYIEWEGIQVLYAAETIAISCNTANAASITISGVEFTPVAGTVQAPPPPPAGTPPAALVTVRVESENLSPLPTGLGVLTQLPGYSGTGYLDYQTTTTHPAIGPYNFPNMPAGTYTINIRYYCYSAQQNYVSIDGGANTNYNYSTLNAWTTLAITGVVLAAGSHTITLNYNFGYTYYDYVELVQTASASPSPAPAPAPSPQNYAFGSRLDGAYPFGIKPTGFTNAAMDTFIQNAWNQWKATRLQAGPTITPTYGIYAGQSVSGIYYDYTAQNNGSVATASEAMGYAMLLCVIMAGYDNNAKTYFDGMFKLIRSRPAYSMTTTANANIYLMDWQLNHDSTLSSNGGGWNASDGDMDMALALLMANRQWGSAGVINYLQEAKNTINALKAANFNQSSQLPGLPYIPPTQGVNGQYTHDCSRTSDYMLGHFTAFKAATSDTFWDSARTSCLSMLNTIITNYNATAGLPPGWVQYPISTIAYPTAGCPRPSPGYVIEGPYEGVYDQNAVRVPWRLGTDFIYSNDTTVHSLVTKMVTTIMNTSGNPTPSATQTSWCYNLNGTQFTGNLYYEPTTDGCQMVGAMVDSALQTWLNDCLTQVGNNYNTNYYSAELSLLGMIVASGNWWRP